MIIYETDPATTSIDNAFKLSSLTALTAAVIVFLDLIGERYTSQNQNQNLNQRNGHGYDEALVNRTVTAPRGCAGGVPGSLCGQCCMVLEAMVDCSRAGKGVKGQRVVVSYLGVVSIERRHGTQASLHERDEMGMRWIFR